MSADILAEYAALSRRADLLFASARASYQGMLRCRPGCCQCCTLSSVLPVEALVLTKAIGQLDANKRAIIRRQAHKKNPSSCPLLLEGRCTVYRSRPLICRTHGAPLAYVNYSGETIEVSACPLNFPADFTFGPEKLLPMEELNRELLHLDSQSGSPRPGNRRRIGIAEIIRKS